MKVQGFSTPNKNLQDHLYSTEDLFTHDPSSNYSSNQGSDKKKTHPPLCISSSRFQARGLISPFLQDHTGAAVDSTDVTHSCVASEPINAPSYLPIIEHLDLASFKIKPCSMQTQHNHKHCPFYHNAKDRKRLGYFYAAELCEFAEKENLVCPNGALCPKAHNRVEQLYRPDKYKTKFCTFYPNNLEKCDYGHYCSFAHNENDIAIELIHNYEYDQDFYMFLFKTIWCPFNLTQHDKALCVYAHNWQDFRRKPQAHIYEPAPCPNWKSTDFILNYEDGCPFHEKCTKCHGWKEHEYHPLNYKTKPCPNAKNCTKGRDCPHFHGTKEKRIISQNISSRVFRYVPRNRIITNTFKVRSEDKIMQYQNTGNLHPSSLLSIYPSLNFSNENDSIYEPVPPYQDQFLRNNSAAHPQVNFAAAFQNIQNIEYREDPDHQILARKFRKHSYDFAPTPPANVRTYSNGSASQYLQNDTPPPGLARTMSTGNNPKTRRWSMHDRDTFNQENEKLFREIVLSSWRKEGKGEGAESPGMGNFEEKQDYRESELNEIILEKIFENEDMY